MKDPLDSKMKLLEKDYSRLMKLFDDFSSIQREFALLSENAATDPQAEAKWRALQALFSDSGGDLASSAMRDLKTLKSALRQFEAYIKAVCPSS